MTNTELIKNLSSKDTKIILQALDYILNHGNHEIVIQLIELLHSNKNEQIHEQLIHIFENIHDQNSVVPITNALKDSKYINERPILLSTCWKNSLKFDDYAELFTDIFIESNFEEAFDAFTVIENLHSISDENITKCTLKLESMIEDANELKKPLYTELIKVILSYKENPAE